MTTITLPPDIDERLTSEARRQGTTPEQLALETLRKSFAPNGENKSQLTDVEKRAARERFAQHIGEVDLGYPTGTDNEQIDADLARQYGNSHETH